MSDVARMPMRPQHSRPSPDVDRAVAGIVAGLLLHYYSPGDLSEAARQAMARDWVEDLREFGPAIAADACREWRRTQERRPTPADIRKLAIDFQRMRHQSAAHQQLPSGVARDLAERRDEDRRMQAARYEDARRVREAMAAELGYPSFSYMLSIGLVAAVRNAPTRRAAGPTAAELGVKAREVSPEKYRADQIALGIEQADDTTTAAGAA